MDDLSPASMFYAINGRRTFRDTTHKSAAEVAEQEAETRRYHAEQDREMQLMLLEQQNKKRLLMARQEQKAMAEASNGGDARTAPSQRNSLPDNQASLDPRVQNDRRRIEAQAREQWERDEERRLKSMRGPGREPRLRRLFQPAKEESSSSGSTMQWPAPYTQAPSHSDYSFRPKHDALLERPPSHIEGVWDRRRERSVPRGHLRKTERQKALKEEVAALAEQNATLRMREKVLRLVPTTISQDCTATAELQQSVLLKRLLK